MEVIVERNHDFDELGESDFVGVMSLLVFEDVLDVLVAEAEFELLFHVLERDVCLI
jgi:hypothetical protein